MHTREPHPPPSHQFTFGHLIADRERPHTPFIGHRRQRHRRDLAALDDRRHDAPDDRRAAFEALCALLASFVGRLGVGESFQAVDFHNWLDRTGQLPSSIDPRATGGAIKRLASAGVIRQTGVRPNGGGRNHHSSLRPVYRVEQLPSQARAASAA